MESRSKMAASKRNVLRPGHGKYENKAIKLSKEMTTPKTMLTRLSQFLRRFLMVIRATTIKSDRGSKLITLINGKTEPGINHSRAIRIAMVTAKA